MTRYGILFFAILSNVSAQICLRFGMKRIGFNSSIGVVNIFNCILKNKYIWLGLFFYGIGFTLYLYILSKFEVSYIYPIITASIFILLLTFSSVLLNEPITIKKTLGIIVIIIGIIITSLK
jgi:multidrug transporter EmrE-like cation transporter